MCCEGLAGKLTVMLPCLASACIMFYSVFHPVFEKMHSACSSLVCAGMISEWLQSVAPARLGARGLQGRRDQTVV